MVRIESKPGVATPGLPWIYHPELNETGKKEHMRPRPVKQLLADPTSSERLKKVLTNVMITQSFFRLRDYIVDHNDSEWARSGVLTRIGIFSSTILLNDGRTLRIPNSEIEHGGYHPNGDK